MVASTDYLDFILDQLSSWKTIHPKTSVVPKLGLTMGLPFWVGSVAFIGLFMTLFWLRLNIASLENQLDARYRNT